MPSSAQIMRDRIEQSSAPIGLRDALAAEAVYDRAAADAPHRAAYEAAAGLAAIGDALVVMARCREADPRAAAASVRGERPTLERLAKAGAERVQTGLLDSAQGASAAAVRVRNGWPPATLHRRGSLSRRHYCAAERLVELWERAQIDRVGGQSWSMPVDRGAAAGEVSERVLKARRVFASVWSMLLPVERHVLGAVVIDARTIEHASESSLVKDISGSGDPKRRALAAATLMRAALERCAALMFDGA